MPWVVGDTAYFNPTSRFYRGALAVERQKNLESFFDRTSMGGSQYGSGNNAMTQAVQAQIDAVNAATAAKQQAAQEALAWQKEQYNTSKAASEAAVEQARGDLAPWRQAGENALGELVTMMEAGPGEYTQSPGYEARLNEGLRAIDRSAAARGGVLSGATMKAANRYAQEFATRDYDNFLNRYYQSLAPYQQLSGMGANAAQQQGAYSMQGASNIANAGQNATNAMTSTNIYGGETTAEGLMNAANIMAAYQSQLAEQNAAYDAWNQGRTA